MLLDQSKVNAGGGGKDQMNRFKRDDLGQEEWELAFRHSETGIACEATEKIGICGSSRIREEHCLKVTFE